MQPETTEWIEIAEGDFLTATREVAANLPNFNAACFHAQQCIEKYLKALLVEHNVAFPKTHQLGFLADLLPQLSADLELIRTEIAHLSPYHRRSLPA
jgi:HEPN domain-containing protein